MLGSLGVVVGCTVSSALVVSIVLRLLNGTWGLGDCCDCACYQFAFHNRADSVDIIMYLNGGACLWGVKRRSAGRSRHIKIRKHLYRKNE